MKVWVSYSFKDRDLAGQLLEYLHEAGIETWVASDVLAPGQLITEQVALGIREANAVIVLLSKESQASASISWEIAVAIHEQANNRIKTIIPVLAEDDVDVPVYLRDRLYVTLKNEEYRPAAFGAIVEALKAAELQPSRAEAQIFPEAYIRRHDELLEEEAEEMALRSHRVTLQLTLLISTLLTAMAAAIPVAIIVLLGGDANLFALLAVILGAILAVALSLATKSVFGS